MADSRLLAFLLLAAANAMWSGNWIAGRALRGALDPLTLNFLRWLVALVILAPFALPSLRGQGTLLRRHAGILLLLAFTGVAAFHCLVYLGLRTTTAINAVLLNSSMPLVMLACSWLIERDRASARQIVGMLVSLGGILVIIARGEPQALRDLELHAGDAWILLAMPVWGVYSVMLKRRPAGLGALPFLFTISAAGTIMLAPFALLQAWQAPPRLPSAPEALAILYMGVAASVLAYVCWNRGVASIGANAAGFTVHLLPVFGTILAITLLGERFQVFHAAGIATILAGVLLATFARAAPRA